MRLVVVQLNIEESKKRDSEGDVSLDDGLTLEEKAKRREKLSSEKHLGVKHCTERSYFNGVHSWYVGHKGLSVDKGSKGLFSTKKGDYIVVMNRGVSDSLYDDEVVSIIQRFHNLKEMSDLDIVADIICSRAFEKMINFDENRPLVSKIKSLSVKTSNVSIDECHCIVLRVE